MGQFVALLLQPTPLHRAGSECKEPHAAPLTSVLHAAGVLRDAALSNQTAAALREVAAAKAWTPDPLHATHSSVLFSSIAAFMGSPGQANYAAANSGLDSLAQRMQAAGLAGSSVQWGAWAGVGMAGEATRARVKRMGMDMVEKEQGLAMLRTLLTVSHAPPLLLANAFDWPRFAEAAVARNPALQRLYSDLVRFSGTALEATAATTSSTQPAITVGALQRIVAEVAGLQVEPDQPLMDAGYGEMIMQTRGPFKQHAGWTRWVQWK